MKIKLVSDSSANICKNITEDVSYVPLKIVTSQKEYVDTPELDTENMLADLKAYKGTSSTSCPSIHDWLTAFGEADVVLGVSLTSGISGCYNAALAAREEYLEENPNAKVFILDTLSTGPELEVLLEKYQDLIHDGCEFDDICDKITEYSKHTHLVFSLGSVDNFAKNGRVNPAVAKITGVLGIRIVGKASDTGSLEPLHKCRGESKAISQLFSTMKDLGYKGGRVRISHTYNPNGAKALYDLIKSELPDSDVHITENRGVCCYYAEAGSVLVGFEDL